MLLPLPLPVNSRISRNSNVALRQIAMHRLCLHMALGQSGNTEQSKQIIHFFAAPTSGSSVPKLLLNYIQ